MDDALESFREARFVTADVKLSPLPNVVAELFIWIDKPIQIDTLVNALIVLLQVNDYWDESVDNQSNAFVESRIADNSLSAASDLEAKELLGRTWRLIQQLPEPQRDTYCLTFEDESGVDLFSLLLETRIATLEQIGEALDRSLKEILRLRAELPMDKAAAAVELHATRQQIYKWRFLAAKTLRAELLR